MNYPPPVPKTGYAVPDGFRTAVQMVLSVGGLVGYAWLTSSRPLPRFAQILLVAPLALYELVVFYPKALKGVLLVSGVAMAIYTVATMSVHALLVCILILLAAKVFKLI